jgi:hypothetical protein
VVTSTTGLIIQGPIYSLGLTGAYFDLDLPLSKRHEKTIFDCIENIHSLVDESKGLFDFVILVTWENELSMVDKNRLEIPVYEIRRPQSGKIISRSNQELSTYVGSKNLQLASVEYGLKVLDSFSCEFAFKIRTDQSIDLNLFKFEVLRNKDVNPRESIYVPYLNKLEPDKFADFYFAGGTRYLLKAISNSVLNGEIFPDAHRDLFYRLAEASAGRKFKSYQLQKIQVDQRILSLFKYWNIAKIRRKYFVPLSRSLWESLSWRGYALTKYDPSGLIFEDESNSFMSYLNRHAFVSYLSYLKSYILLHPRLRRIQKLYRDTLIVTDNGKLNL